jgi:pilus assembly protein CpaB
LSRRVILMSVAVVVAVLGAGLVFLYVQGADNRAEQQFETVNVLQATATIEPGESIDDAASAGKLTLGAVAQSDLLPNYQTDTTQLEGQVATTTIYAGEQIIADKFGGEMEAAAATSALQIPKDMVAISVNLTDPSRVAGFVNPGSDVAIFQTTDGYSRLVLPRVTVLGVGSTTPTQTTTTSAEGEQTTEALPRTLLTIAVKQREAEKVQFAAYTGEVSFGLLTEGSDVGPGPGVDINNLFK